MVGNTYSVAPIPPVPPAPTTSDATVGQSAAAVKSFQAQQTSNAQPAHDTVDIASSPITRSLQLGSKIMAQLDQETTRITSALAQPSPGMTPAERQGPDKKGDGDPANSDPSRFAPKDDKDTGDAALAKKLATSTLIPMQIAQGKVKSLAQSGRSPDQIALELHLDVRTVEEYLGVAASQAQSGEAGAGATLAAG